MSLDNAIAIAAAAGNDFTLIVIGLAISIPIIILGATVIARMLDRFPWLGMVGAALIGWIAGEVMAGDGKVGDVIGPGTVAAWLDVHVPHAEYVCAAAGAVFVVGLGLVISKLRERRSGET